MNVKYADCHIQPCIDHSWEGDQMDFEGTYDADNWKPRMYLFHMRHRSLALNMNKPDHLDILSISPMRQSCMFDVCLRPGAGKYLPSSKLYQPKGSNSLWSCLLKRFTLSVLCYYCRCVIRSNLIWLPKNIKKKLLIPSSLDTVSGWGVIQDYLQFWGCLRSIQTGSVANVSGNVQGLRVFKLYHHQAKTRAKTTAVGRTHCHSPYPVC